IGAADATVDAADEAPPAGIVVAPGAVGAAGHAMAVGAAAAGATAAAEGRAEQTAAALGFLDVGVVDGAVRQRGRCFDRRGSLGRRGRRLGRRGSAVILVDPLLGGLLMFRSNHRR